MRLYTKLETSYGKTWITSTQSSIMYRFSADSMKELAEDIINTYPIRSGSVLFIKDATKDEFLLTQYFTTRQTWVEIGRTMKRYVDKRNPNIDYMLYTMRNGVVEDTTDELDYQYRKWIDPTW